MQGNGNNYHHGKDGAAYFSQNSQQEQNMQENGQNYKTQESQEQQDLMGQYSGRVPTEIRRKYPKDVLERKNEWEAIEKHKLEINSQLRQSEDEIRNYRQKELMTELDRKMLLKLEEKKSLLEQKHNEATYAQQQHHQFLEQQVKQKQDKRFLGQIMSGYYDKQRDDQISKDRQMKQQKLDWENRLLEHNSEILKKDEEMRKQHKQYLQQEKLADVQRANEKKEIEKHRQGQNTKEYQNLLKQNAERELTKELNYREYYKVAADEQNKKHNMHFEKVLKPNMTREQYLQSIIQKNYDNELKRRSEDELQRILNRQQQSEYTNVSNRALFQEKQNQQDLQKIEQNQRVKDRLSDLQDYNKYLEQKKQEKLQNQNSYKSYLDQQSKEKEDIFNGSLRMTKAEKGLNKLDLQAYKEVDGGMYSMLPGWSPQIGQLPPKQNRERLQQQLQQQLRRQGDTVNMGQDWKNTYNKQLEQEKKLYANNENTSINRFQKVGEPLSKYNASAIYSQPGDYTNKNSTSSNNGPNSGRYANGSTPNSSSNLMRNNSAVLGYGHNPITNPMPFNIQNPYIAKEFMRAQSQSGSVFQQMGGSIVSH